MSTTSGQKFNVDPYEFFFISNYFSEPENNETWPKNVKNKFASSPKRLILKVYLLDQDKIRIFCHFINVLMAFWTGELKCQH
jgi:hypothetical protein